MEERQLLITLGCFTFLMVFVCELETQILLAGDLGLLDKGELVTAKKVVTEIERMLKVLIKSRKQTLEPWNPWTLFSN
jgi:hypothetical protein